MTLEPILSLIIGAVNIHYHEREDYFDGTPTPCRANWGFPDIQSGR
jgi:hypothetical protein